MDYANFVTAVAQLAGTDRAGAERAIRATLQTLAEHLTREEARQVAGLLPAELGAWLHTGSGGRSVLMSTSSFAGSAGARRWTCLPHSVLPPRFSPP